MMPKIDFVIPWVNSDDLQWQKKKQSFSATGLEEIPSSNGSERFRDYGTLKYLVRSIEKYANWVHRVYIITDAQAPDWLNKSALKQSKFRIIDHQDIIQERDLPSFNSNAIELSAINIPNLAEQFVVFNDDFLINSKTTPDDFFKNGLPRDFRIYTELRPSSDYDSILFNNSLAINNWLERKWRSKKGLFHYAYGLQNIKNFYHSFFSKDHWVSSYSFPHNAQGFLKSTFSEAENIWAEDFAATRANHFRTPQDISILLIRNYQLEIGCFEVRRPGFSQYYTLNNIDEIERELLEHIHPLICLNDADTHNYAAVTERLNRLLSQAYPDPSDIELK